MESQESHISHPPEEGKLVGTVVWQSARISSSGESFDLSPAYRSFYVILNEDNDTVTFAPLTTRMVPDDMRRCAIQPIVPESLESLEPVNGLSVKKERAVSGELRLVLRFPSKGSAKVYSFWRGPVGRPMKHRRTGKLTGEIVVSDFGGLQLFAVIVGETPKTVLLAKLKTERLSGYRGGEGFVRPILPGVNALDSLLPSAFRARKGGRRTSLCFRHQRRLYGFWDGGACWEYSD